ncbi:hypothetical protein TNCV_2662731 [Trichonephila clavipes]|nr:hypothetical protein TNCV_2662731 [Trichonephila clavipes]
MYSKGDRYGDRTGQDNNQYPVYRRKAEHDMRHVVLYYLVGRGHFSSLDDRAQSLDGSAPHSLRNAGLWKVREIQLAVQYDPSQPMDFIFAWQWLDLYQWAGRYHGTIIYVLDRQ